MISSFLPFNSIFSLSNFIIFHVFSIEASMKIAQFTDSSYPTFVFLQYCKNKGKKRIHFQTSIHFHCFKFNLLCFFPSSLFHLQIWEIIIDLSLEGEEVYQRSDVNEEESCLCVGNWRRTYGLFGNCTSHWTVAVYNRVCFAAKAWYSSFDPTCVLPPKLCFADSRFSLSKHHEKSSTHVWREKLTFGGCERATKQTLINVKC